jgi:hypothetical protein
VLFLHGRNPRRKGQKALEVAIRADQGSIGEDGPLDLLARSCGIGLEQRERASHLGRLAFSAPATTSRDSFYNASPAPTKWAFYPLRPITCTKTRALWICSGCI